MTSSGSRTEAGEVAFVSASEWAARGRAARQAAPRSSHGRWQPAASRPNPVALLEEQAQKTFPTESRRRK